MSFPSQTATPPQSFREHGPVSLLDYTAERLRGLCEGAGYGAETERVVETFRRLVSPWAEVPAGYRSAWRSDISDDHTPIEFSVTAGDGRTEVRALLEVQAEAPTLLAYRAAGLAFAERLEREFGADLGRFRLVEDLFLSPDMKGPFAVWFAVVFPLGGAPKFKAYLNPKAQGPELAEALVEQALRRLGFPEAWPELARTAVRRGPHLDELRYFSLDLEATPEARLKVYVQHHHATPEEFEQACSAARSYTPGEASAFARAMSGGVERLVARSPFTCSNFVADGLATPVTTTLYVPVCAYARDDAAVRDRVSAYLREHSEVASTYEALLQAFADRPLDAGVGMQSWVAFRRHQGLSRFTVYLGTESRWVHPPGAIPAATEDRAAFASAEEVVRCFERFSLRAHPLLQRLLHEPPNPEAVWLLIHNAYEGTSKHFIRWLAALTAQVEDDRLRCLLARQLDQELGEGDFSKAHSVLMRAFLEGLAVLKPGTLGDADFQPGWTLGTRLSWHYLARDWHESLAALMAGEICAHQLIFVVARLLRMQPRTLSETALSWLRAHEELEGDHAGESLVLARMLPPGKDAIEGVWRGTLGVHTALWRFLSDMYERLYGAGGLARGTPALEPVGFQPLPVTQGRYSPSPSTPVTS